MNAITPRAARPMRTPSMMDACMRLNTSFNIEDVRNIVIDERYIIPFFSERLAYVPTKDAHQAPFFVLGNVYVLCGAECEDFQMPSKEYELVAILDNANGIVLDSVVMKQISGERNTIFSLTRLDCQNLGIEFQRGLQIFPKNLNWVKKEVTQEVSTEDELAVEFNSNILATYPKNYDDGLIHRVVIKISGFKKDPRGIISQDNGYLVTERSLRPGFSITTKQRIGSATNTNSATFPIGYHIPYEIITQRVSRCNGGYVDEDGCIFLELNLTRTDFNNRVIGLNPELLGDASFNDLFSIKIVGAKKISPTNEELERLRRTINKQMVNASLEEIPW